MTDMNVMIDITFRLHLKGKWLCRGILILLSSRLVPPLQCTSVAGLNFRDLKDMSYSCPASNLRCKTMYVANEYG